MTVVIAGARRTPIGSLAGVFADVSATSLGATAIAAALADAGVDGADVAEVTMGCVLPAGLGQAPARQAGLGGGLPESVPATTLNKMCGSGMKALMDATDHVALGHAPIAVAGGMESMTRAPHLLPRLRSGVRLGHDRVLDHLFLDGLEDAYESGRPMGSFGEDCAAHYGFTREAQDAFAIESLLRARRAAEDGTAAREIAPVTVRTRRNETVVNTDEQPTRADADRIPTLKPAFSPDGTITAANASSISDGAAALVLMDETTARERGAPIRARVLGHATHAQAPRWFSTAPTPAVRRLLERHELQPADIDLWEINEAFAVVPMAAMHELGIAHDRVNVFGGACALGHPIGASGARIVVTLLNALNAQDGRYGVATACIGGGEATAVLIERLQGDADAH